MAERNERNFEDFRKAPDNIGMALGVLVLGDELIPESKEAFWQALEKVRVNGPDGHYSYNLDGLPTEHRALLVACQQALFTSMQAEEAFAAFRKQAALFELTVDLPAL